MYHILLTSDLHFNSHDPSDLREEKKNNLKLMEKISRERSLTALLIPGDLVNQTEARFHFPQDADELNSFLQWRDQAKKVFPFNSAKSSEAPIYYSHGNHDTYVTGIGKLYLNQRVRTHICFKYGWLDYRRTLVKDQLDLIALSCNPINKINIVKYLLKATGNRKIIVMWHFDTSLESGDWTAKDRDKIYSILEPYKDRILCICNAHMHYNKVYTFQGFKVITAGGAGLGLISVNGSEVKVTFVRDINEEGNYVIELNDPSSTTYQVVSNLGDAVKFIKK